MREAPGDGRERESGRKRIEKEKLKGIGWTQGRHECQTRAGRHEQRPPRRPARYPSRRPTGRPEAGKSKGWLAWRGGDTFLRDCITRGLALADVGDYGPGLSGAVVAQG
ncbi:hypothetical protein ROR02_20740 [Pararhodospirillum oryzae]|uniref:Uncharacterized protein n=1 Tax=Pararhodospirillum oryzae TaxID=478448 RepID=A0A512H915_9PROT|nr:hypothetical protein ROR02_20740 [Pararhodospirillum oryzae]